MTLTTALLCWSMLLVVQRGAGSHSGVTRVLPVEQGLADFQVTSARPEASPPPPPQPPSTATLPTPPLSLPPQWQPPPPLREEYVAPESSVRFPNNLDVDLGDKWPLVRGAQPFPVWANNAQRYIPSHGSRTGMGAGGGAQADPAIDNAASVSVDGYLQGGEYLQEDVSTPSLLGGQTDSEVTFRHEHHPSIFIKNPTFNSVAIGFIMYLMLLTLLQNSMLNWSQKGALLTLGATTQRNQKEVLGRAKPLFHHHVSTTTTTPTTLGVDNRARIQPDAKTTGIERPDAENNARGRFPVSVAAAAILDQDHNDNALAPYAHTVAAARPGTAGASASAVYTDISKTD